MMQADQPVRLDIEKLRPTVTYLRQACGVLGSLQRAFIPKEPHLWHYGLEISLRGITTQAFSLGDKPVRASLDLYRHKLRILNDSWSLREYPPADLLVEVSKWLEEHGQSVKLEEPKFVSGVAEYDYDQSDAYAEALWWMDGRFRELKGQVRGGLSSPILLYPHHFDLSFTWFPFNDEQQIAVGWSTGDETVPEPYIYLTAYPEPKELKKLDLPAEAHWQSQGFSGAVLPYSALVGSKQPGRLFEEFSRPQFNKSVFG